MHHGRRPSPLSDEVFMSGPPPVLLGAEKNLGATNNGVPLPVKNTFVDMPSGNTPASTKGWRESMMTAPAILKKQMGFTLQTATPLPETAPSPAWPPSIGETPPATPGSANGFHYAVTTPTSTPLRVHSYLPHAAGLTGPGSTAYPTPYAQTPPAPPGNLQDCQTLWQQNNALPAQFAWPEQTSVGAVAKAWADQPSHGNSGAVEAQNEEDSDDESDDAPEQPASSQLRSPEDAPKPPPGAQHPSVGSAGHSTGCCKRCCFFPRGRCANGYECEFCHYEHDKRKRKNKKKRTIRARGLQLGGNRRLFLAEELMRSSATRDTVGGRQVITVPAAAMERRPGSTQLPPSPLILQTAYSQAAGAAQVAPGPMATWLAAPSQPVMGYCQAPGQQQQLFVYGGGPSAAQFYAAPTQVVVHSPQQPASHVIVLPPATSQASQRLSCDPPPPPVQSPRMQHPPSPRYQSLSGPPPMNGGAGGLMQHR
mmetsp:Transcript_54307/g.126446  ORF Transcript_54307/g.126446 Transcript_54307/m.126446 type:complete len:480 (-) Transcript_54307:183-1622(-)